MGKKRRILAAKGKYGNKFSEHPRYKAVIPASPAPTATEQIKVIAKKVETIEQEVKVAEEEVIEAVVAAEIPQETIKPQVKSVASKTKKAAKKVSTVKAVKKNTTTKRKTTRKTAVN